MLVLEHIFNALYLACPDCISALPCPGEATQQQGGGGRTGDCARGVGILRSPVLFGWLNSNSRLDYENELARAFFRCSLYVAPISVQRPFVLGQKGRGDQRTFRSSGRYFGDHCFRFTLRTYVDSQLAF